MSHRSPADEHRAVRQDDGVEVDAGQAHRHRLDERGGRRREVDGLGMPGGNGHLLARRTTHDHHLLALGRGQQHARGLVAQHSVKPRRHRLEPHRHMGQVENACLLRAAVVHPASAEEHPPVGHHERCA